MNNNNNIKFIHINNKLTNDLIYFFDVKNKFKTKFKLENFYYKSNMKIDCKSISFLTDQFNLSFPK